MHIVCNAACCLCCLYVGVNQIGILTAEWGLIEFAVAWASVVLALKMWKRPRAEACKLDGKTILLCGLCSSYYFLFRFEDEIWKTGELIGTVAVSAGCLLWCASAFWLGSSFSVLPAFRRVQSWGPYRVIRHPMYLSYIVIDAGVLVMWPSWWNCGVVGVGIGMYWLRAIWEEEVLERDDGYREYCQRTRYRIIPGVI